MQLPAESRKSLTLLAVVLLLSALVFSGCGKKSTSAYTFTTPAPPAFVTLSLTPSSVMPGQSATIAWTSENATSCTASGAWAGTLAISGSATVMLQANKPQTYSLSCSGTGSAGSKSVTLNAGSQQAACTTGVAVRAQSGKRTVHGRKLTGAHS